MTNIVGEFQPIIRVAWDFLFIFGCFFAYIPQYFEILRTQNINGFSLHVSLLLVVACTLRVFFWYLKKFEDIILYQSLSMIISHLALLYANTSVKSQRNITSSNSSSPKHYKAQRFRQLLLRNFWDWDHLSDYLEFLGCFCISMTLITILFRNNYTFIECVGWISLICEGCFAVPQAWRNFQNKSVKGLSLSLVVMWIVGDVPKTIYFIYSQAPIQFIFCGIFQMMVDCFIIGQIVYYTRYYSGSTQLQAKLSLGNSIHSFNGIEIPIEDIDEGGTVNPNRIKMRKK